MICLEDRVLIKDSDETIEVKHKFNMFRASYSRMKGDHCVIQDYKGEIWVFDQQETLNKLYMTSENINYILFDMGDQIMALS